MWMTVKVFMNLLQFCFFFFVCFCFLAKRHVRPQLPDQGLNPHAPALESDILTTGPAGKAWNNSAVSTVSSEKSVLHFLFSLIVWSAICNGTRPCMCAKSLQSCPTLCDSMDRGQPRCLRLWDSPGKNTGVDCCALLQGSSRPRDRTRIS